MKFSEKWVLVPLFIDSWNLVLPELILQMLNYQHLHVIIYGGQAIPWKSAMNKNRYHTTHLMNYRISRSPNWLHGYGTRTFQLLGLHSPPRKRTYFWQALMGWWVGTWQAVWSACQSGTGVGWVLVCGFLGLPSAGFEFSSFVFSFYCWPESVDGWIQTCPIPASGEHWGYWNNPNNPVYCFSLSCLQCK